jgi:hypothetical protein
VVLTDFSLVNIGSILLFALSGVLTPGFVRLLYYQGMKKLGAPVNSSLFAVYPLYTSLLAVLFLSEFFGAKQLGRNLDGFLRRYPRGVEFSGSWQPEHSFKKRFDLSGAWWFGIWVLVAFCASPL